MLSHNKVNMNSLAKIVSLKFTIASVIFVSDVENSWKHHLQRRQLGVTGWGDASPNILPTQKFPNI